MDNLWIIKDILRGFELSSGLQVIFLKNCLIGVNMDSSFLDQACDFLHCKQEYLPFKYLGLLVRTNPRSESTWEPLVTMLFRRLNS